MALEGVKLSFPATFVAAGALAVNTLVKIDSAGKVTNTGAGDIPLGWVPEGAGADGDLVTVYPLGPKTPCITTAAITVGQYIKCGAAGKTVVESTPTTPTALTIGQALSVGGTAAAGFFAARV